MNILKRIPLRVIMVLLVLVTGGWAAAEKPNIVFIIIDDLGPFDLSCTGSEVLKTPNIDRIAQEGIQFTRAYSGCTVCAPARSTLMTGKHMGHTTVRGNLGGIPLKKEDVTVAQVLKKAGYVSGGYGKWGIGDVRTDGVPEKHGFDDFFGYYHQVHAHTFYPRFLWRNSKKAVLSGNARPLLDAGGDIKAYREDKEYLGKQFSHHLIFEEAMNFIRTNKDRPFFCYLPWTPPHGPYPDGIDDPAIKEFANHPWSRDDRVYAGMVKMVDRQVGEILNLLVELGIDEKTIVFFCSDNGGTRARQKIFSTNRSLKGSKGDLYEGGLRIPFLVRWPGKIKAGTTSDLLCYFPDIMPTFAQLTGTTNHLPEDIDGLSIVPTLLGISSAQDRHDFLYWEYPLANFLEKSFPPDKVLAAVRKGKWKGVRPGTTAPWELYDLDRDRGETKNLADKHPAIVKEMQDIAKASHVDAAQIEPSMPDHTRFRH